MNLFIREIGLEEEEEEEEMSSDGVVIAITKDDPTGVCC